MLFPMRGKSLSQIGYQLLSRGVGLSCRKLTLSVIGDPLIVME